MPSCSVRRYKRPTKGCQKVTLKELFLIKKFSLILIMPFLYLFFFFLSFFRGQWKDDTIGTASMSVCDCFMCNNSGVLITKYIWLEEYL